MRKSFLAAAMAITVMATSNSAILVQAGTQNCNRKLFEVKEYVISKESTNCGEKFKDILSDLNIELESIKLNNCSIIIYPGIIRPGNDSSCTDKPETENPETNKPEIETPDTNVPETEEPTTQAPDVNEPETSKPNVEETTTEAVSKPEEDNQEKSYAEQVVDLVNQERAKVGLSKLTLDKNIEAAALVRAKETEVYFSHTRPNGSSFSTVLKEHNVNYRGAGENIAWGQTSPEAVMNAWMNSEGHRANILNANFTKIGVGYYQNSAGRKYWTQLFTY